MALKMKALSMRIRTYRELSRLKTFEERYAYLRLCGEVGASTFGFDRFLNQRFYKSKEWLRVKSKVILRDNGCDLGIEGYDIQDRIIVHHMNPITIEDLEEGSDFVLDPEFLICTTHNTHNAIHYGDESLLYSLPKERKPGDTKLW